MAHTNRVVRSINNDDGHLCRDIFRRPDGTFGFEEYRCDPEDARGWFAVGFHGNKRFETGNDAYAAACDQVVWLTAASA